MVCGRLQQIRFLPRCLPLRIQNGVSKENGLYTIDPIHRPDRKSTGSTTRSRLSVNEHRKKNGRPPTPLASSFLLSSAISETEPTPRLPQDTNSTVWNVRNAQKESISSYRFAKKVEGTGQRTLVDPNVPERARFSFCRNWSEWRICLRARACVRALLPHVTKKAERTGRRGGRVREEIYVNEMRSSRA